MDDLHVNSELTATVRNDKDADGATARLESSLQTRPEVALLNDGEVLLDVTSLGHGDDGTLLDVEDPVLLEDWAEHALDDHGGGGVRDGAGLLVELLGEEVDTEVTVLAGGGRGGDADDLAGTALEDQDVAQADVVAGDGDGGGSVLVRSGANTAARAGRRADLGVLDMAGSFMVVENTVSQLVDTMAEGVVVALKVSVQGHFFFFFSRGNDWWEWCNGKKQKKDGLNSPSSS
jgi:hypothetical protein